MDQKAYAGKRIEFSSGTFDPSAMLKINKDVNFISPRQPNKDFMSKQIKLVYASCQMLSNEINEHKKQQNKNFRELRIELQEINKEIHKMRK